MSFDFFDEGAHIDPVVLHHDLGRLSGLLEVPRHHRVHLKYAHEALLVPQIVVLLFYLLGRLVDGKVVAYCLIDGFLRVVMNEFGLFLEEFFGWDHLELQVPFALRGALRRLFASFCFL